MCGPEEHQNGNYGILKLIGEEFHYEHDECETDADTYAYVKTGPNTASITAMSWDGEITGYAREFVFDSKTSGWFVAEGDFEVEDEDGNSVYGVGIQKGRFWELQP